MTSPAHRSGSPFPAPRLLFWGIAGLALLVHNGCEARGQDGPKNRPPTIDVERPTGCKGCHAVVVAEWERSMHARADTTKDPIYAALREMRRKKQGDAVAQRCVTCHGPRAASTGRAALAVHGVSCAACHNVAAIDRAKGLGAEALVAAGEGVMLGPHDVKPGRSPVHGTGEAPPHMRDGSALCLACHDAMANPAGAPTCTTGPEWRGEGEAGDASCVSCHMPTVAGPSGAVSKRREHRSHQFLGPHRAWQHDDASLLEQAVKLGGKIEGEAAVITLEATSGHAFPSGFPGRFARIEIAAKDSGGEVVARPEPVTLGKVYVDAEGQRVPAAFAAKLQKDTRLKAGERRSFTFGGIPKKAATVEVRLSYGLLPPPLAAKLGLSAEAVAKPRVIKRTTLKR